MTLLAIPFLLSALSYLVLGSWILIRHKSKVQMLFGALCISTCFWQGIWTALLSNVAESQLSFWLKVGYSGIVLIPPIFYHFIYEFTQKETQPQWLTLFYSASAT